MTDVTRIHVGASEDPDVERAVRDAVGSALANALDPAIALVFTTWQYAPERLAEALGRALGSVPFAGCSTIAVFADTKLVEHGIVVGIIDSPGLRVGVGVGEGVALDSRAAGERAVASALDKMPLLPGERRRLLVLLPDTANGDAANLVRGALAEGGSGVVWAGGGAGDALGAHRLVQLGEGTWWRDAVVAVAIDLPARVGTGVRHGMQPVGSPVMVTRAAGVLAHELEYRSAFEIYCEAAAADGVDLDREGFASYAMLHPLGIPQANEEYLVRDPLAVEEDGALRCVAEVPDGALVRVMRADPSEIVRAAGAAAASAVASAAGAPAGALVFDCMSRHLILGGAFQAELEAFRAELGPKVPLFGCLTYGEVAAFGYEVPQFHNKTTVVVVIPE